MSKSNNVIKRVFAEVAETSRQKGSYEKFLGIDKEIGLSESELLTLMKERYIGIINNIKYDISILASLEEVIMQLRAREMIESELRLSLNKNFIYARATFYRSENKINDIRVIAGRIEDYGDDLESLINDPSFRSICIEKVKEAMDKEIEKNVFNLNLIFNEKFV